MRDRDDHAAVNRRLQDEIQKLQAALRCPSTEAVWMDGGQVEVRCDLRIGHDGEHRGTARVEYETTWETPADAEIADLRERLAYVTKEWDAASKKVAKLRRMVADLQAELGEVDDA